MIFSNPTCHSVHYLLPQPLTYSTIESSWDLGGRQYRGRPHQGSLSGSDRYTTHNLPLVQAWTWQNLSGHSLEWLDWSRSCPVDSGRGPTVKSCALIQDHTSSDLSSHSCCAGCHLAAQYSWTAWSRALESGSRSWMAPWLTDILEIWNLSATCWSRYSFECCRCLSLGRRRPDCCFCPRWSCSSSSLSREWSVSVRISPARPVKGKY